MIQKLCGDPTRAEMNNDHGHVHNDSGGTAKQVLLVFVCRRVRVKFTGHKQDRGLWVIHTDRCLFSRLLHVNDFCSLRAASLLDTINYQSRSGSCLCTHGAAHSCTSLLLWFPFLSSAKHCFGFQVHPMLPTSKVSVPVCWVLVLGKKEAM